MAVQVHGMVLGEGRVDDQVHPLVLVGEMDDALLGCPGVVVVGHMHQRRIIPFGVEGGLVHGPQQGVRGDLDCDLFTCTVGKIVRGIDGYVRDEVRGGLIGTGVSISPGRGRGVCRGRVVITDDALDIVQGIRLGAGLLGDCAQPKVPAVQLFSRNNDIVALAHADTQLCGVVGVNGDKIRRNHFHGVVINHEAEMVVSCRVDETNAVSGTCIKGCLETRTVVAISVCPID